MEGSRRRADWICIVGIALAFTSAPAFGLTDDPARDESREEQHADPNQPEIANPSADDAEHDSQASAVAESPLVRAARMSRAKSDDGASRVYTNEDVLKSKGSLIVVKEQPPIVEATPDDEERRATLEGRALDKVNKDYEDRISAIEEEIATLVEEQRSLEDNFYEEVDDPADREAAEERFEELRKQIAEATAKLDKAREDYQKFLVEYRKKKAVW